MTATLDSFAQPQPAPPAAADSFGHRLAPPGDPLEGSTFDAIFDAKIKPELEKCEAERVQAVKTFFIVLAAGAVAIFIENLLAPSFAGPGAMVDFRIALFTAVGFGIGGYMPLMGVAKRAKVSIIQALCGPLGVTYAADGKDAPSWTEFNTLNLLPHPSDHTFEDFFTGKRGDIDFALCEATLTQGSGKNRRTVFHGQLLSLTSQRQRLGTTVVLRNTGWMKRFECPGGLKGVGLEDPHFNGIFAVFGSDQVEAREILTPTFMQQLCDLETAYAGGHIRCAFCGPELIIALEGPNRFEIGNMFSTLVDRTRVQNIAQAIEQVFKTIDQFSAA